MLGITLRMYDLTPNNPVIVTDGAEIVCSSLTEIYPIGSASVRHAFIVLQDADIVVKNASGQTLQRGTDYFTISRAMDQAYSKQYSTSIFSGIKFKMTGTYTVTSFLTCGTYPRATWFNYVLETLLGVINTTIPALQSAVNTLASSVSDMVVTITQHSQTLTDHGSRLTVLESNPTIIVVADHATMLALTSVKIGTTVYVVADTDGKRAEYLYDGTTYQKTSDPDWENINIEWSALLNIPTGVAALIAGTLASTTLADMPTPADADDTKVLSWDKTTGKYRLLTVSAAAGVGDVAGPTSAVSGNIAGYTDSTGKNIGDLGVAPADLYASACASQDVTTADVTISINREGVLILSGALTGSRFVYLPATVWRKTIICQCTGAYYLTIRAVGQTVNGVNIYPGDATDVYCNGTVVKRVPRRLGDLYVGMHATAPENVLLFDGSTKARTAYPELWAMISAGRLPSVTDTAWLAGAVGAFSLGNGSSTFRLPDWRGLFPRMAGINSVLAMANGTKYTGGSLADVMLDMMQGHWHEWWPSQSVGTASYTLENPNRGTPARQPWSYDDYVRGAIADDTNGTPRTGAETRPASVSVNFGIYFE